MSKIGQYVVEALDKSVIDISDDCYVGDDSYWQAHEFDDSEPEWPQIKIKAWYDLTNLPPDVKEKLADCGIDDFLLDDDLPF